MKKALLIISILFCFYSINAQKVINKEFCINEFGDPASSEKNANYIKLTIKESDGTKRYEIRDIKSDKLVSLKRFKKDIPVGKWIAENGKELNYDFELVYSKKEYENIIKYNVYEKKAIGEIEGNFEVPVFPKFKNNFRLFVAENLRYPVTALKKDIQGKVISQFIIDEDGNIVNLSILESAHKILDKEAARAIMESPKWIPAKIDGKPVRVHVIIHNVFFYTEETDD